MSHANDSQNDAPKVGVYICRCGGNISDHVDVAKVAEIIQGLPDVAVTHTNMFMCSDPGQELIQQDIKSGKINRVVVASCAPSLHELTFRNAIKRAKMNPYLYDHANIREQDSWVHHGEAATNKAKTLISAAVAKCRNLRPLEPIRVDAHNHATVIGGGVAGLRAALDLAKRGIRVALVEKSPFLGGRAADLTKVYPGEEDAKDLIVQLADAVCEHDLIDIHTCTEIVAYDGYVGNFKLTLKHRAPKSSEDLSRLDKLVRSGQKEKGYVPFAGYYPRNIPATEDMHRIDTGTIILATGFKTYTPRTGEFGYGEGSDVILLSQLIESMANEKSTGSTLKIMGRIIRRLALIHCVGSRRIPGIHEPDEHGNLNEYCSRTCCCASLQAAIEIREKFSETHVLEYYRDIRTYGRGQEELYDRAAGNNVLFFRYEPENPPVVERITGEFPLKITVNDTLTFGEKIEAEVDLVVLAAGMEAGSIQALIEMMKLPLGADRFLQEIHPKLRPVELSNTGVLLAGTCQAPMDIGEACNTAQAAAAKAAILLSKGYVELDPFVAQVNADKCCGTGACVNVCPVEAVKLTNVNLGDQIAPRAEVNPALCTGCGICVAECPHNAIDVMGWTLKQYEAMVDAVVAT